MSMHRIPLTELERAGLINYGLAAGKPSQLSDVFRHGMKWALDNVKAVSQWIPVSERLPDEDAVVVGRSDDPIEYCDYAVFNFFNGIFHLNTDGLEASNYDGGAVIKCEFAVTHWMPLPSAPEQNK